MLRRTIELLLPVIFPSWRFFMTVGPSPRIEYRMINKPESDWQESHPIPAHVSPLQMAGRMLWNHPRNTQLYMVALAERLVSAPSEHSVGELMRLISDRHGAEGAQLQFRLRFLLREDDRMLSEVLYESAPFSRAGPDA